MTDDEFDTMLDNHQSYLEDQAMVGDDQCWNCGLVWSEQPGACVGTGHYCTECAAEAAQEAAWQAAE